ncbi:MAG: LacI family DNA-binding transcriptional regulator [Rhodanobacteraceae bacterium]|nr:LacI family DNA-binding transcriptional regulator [Rhodanobacteraceae bacterium]
MAVRVRIEDVAAAAGVSMKTVSRVLNHEPNVREDTRLKVTRAVEELKYTPHLSARSLAGSKSFLVALLYNNPSASYLMGVIEGVLKACSDENYHTLLCPLEDDEARIVAGAEALIARSQPDGLVLTPPITDSPALLARLAELEIPYACVSPKDQSHGMGVAMDETRAAYDMVMHLASLGHRRIAHVIGHPAHGASGWRLTGYRQGLERAGIKFDPALVVQGEFSFESGVRAASALLDLERRPSAVFAANDDMAAGVIRVALERNLRVPEDLSVCGFDDTPMSRQIFPALTTVQQPTYEMGRIATLELLASIRNPESGRMVRVPYALKLRQSTGPVQE